MAELIARTARWVHPETFRALPVWAPYAGRGQPLFDAGWSRRYTNTRKATGITSEKFGLSDFRVELTIATRSLIPIR